MKIVKWTWADWKLWFLGTRDVWVPAEKVRKGHLMLEVDGALVDLGPCTLEDVKMIAYVSQEAYARLKRSKVTPKTLAKVRRLTHDFWVASENPDNLRRVVPGLARKCDCEKSVAVGEHIVVSGGE